MKQTFTKTNAKKLLITVWDILLQISKVAGAVALYRLNIAEYNVLGYTVSLTKLTAGVLIAAVIVHYLQTRKD